ncbi:DUF7096 domain-containing protein [Halobellus salinisoli]|uniref:DUF7096 domain-containing protein n=1 Tax=Halobellus salinisoli TaxID=3108500 RepID=UPI003009FDDA
MRSELTLLVALVVVLAMVPIGAVATAADSPASLAAESTSAQVDGTDTATPQSNETDETASEEDESSSLSPGAQLAGVVAVQRTEIDSEVGSRAFGQRVAAAATNDSKAAVIATDVNDSRERIDRLRERLAELERSREAGNVSEGRYRANAAQLTAEINAIERRLEQANESASTLPEPVREANGINTSNIERLRTEARNLSGPEIAEIARGIAGDNAGRGMSAAAPGRSGGLPGQSDSSPGERGDAPDRSGDQLGDATGNATNDSERDAGGNGNPVASGGRDRGSQSTDLERGSASIGDGGEAESNATRGGAANNGSSGETARERESGSSERDGITSGVHSSDDPGQGEDVPGQSGDVFGQRGNAFASTATDLLRAAASVMD